MHHIQTHRFYLFPCVITILLFSSSIATKSNNLIPETCKKISGSDPTVKYPSCMAAFGSDPRSSRAKSMSELGSISFEVTISKAKSMVSTIEGLLKDPKFDPATRSALRDCSDLYRYAPDDLRESLDALRKRDFSTANVKASAVLDSSVDCDDSFKEKGVTKSPLSGKNNEFYQFTAVSLAFTVLLK